MEEELNFISEKIERLEGKIDFNIKMKFPNWVEASIKLDKELTIYNNILSELTNLELKKLRS